MKRSILNALRMTQRGWMETRASLRAAESKKAGFRKPAHTNTRTGVNQGIEASSRIQMLR